MFVTTINGKAVTSTRQSVFTSTPGVGDRKSGGSNDNNGFFDDSGKVGGTFAVVGIVVVASLLGLGWFLYRRHKAKRMDRDVMAAASAAQATTRTPFDDDDEYMSGMDNAAGGPFQTPGEGSGSNGASIDGNGGNVMHPYYSTAFNQSGYHQPEHYLNMVDDPYASSLNGSGNAGAGPALGMGGLAAPATQYYSPHRGPSMSSDSQRGYYESVPTDLGYNNNNTNEYNFNQRPSFDSVPYGAGSSAAAYAAAPQDPFRDSSEPNTTRVMPTLPSMGGMSGGSGRVSSASEYEPAHSTMSHQQPVSLPNLPQNSVQPTALHNMSNSNYNHNLMDTQHVGGVPNDQNSGVWPPYVSGAAPVSYNAPSASTSAFATENGMVNQSAVADRAPAYDPGDNPPHVSDSKQVPVSMPREGSSDNAITQFPPERANGVVQAFGGDNEGQSAFDHGDWDPPALSSAWFPTSVGDQPGMLQGLHTQQQGPINFSDRDVPTPRASAQNLMVRNPSPEDHI